MSETRLFGTDGVRGTANVHPMTAEMALSLGQAIARIFRAEGSKNRRIIIGKDTRLSGYLFDAENRGCRREQDRSEALLCRLEYGLCLSSIEFIDFQCDAIEQDDRVVDNDAGQGDEPEDGKEPKWRVCDQQPKSHADQAKGNGRENDYRSA